MSLYEKPVLFAVAAVAVVSVGTAVTMVVPLVTPSTQPTSRLVAPYTAVELEGRDIYIREGCNNCHTQTVRPLRTEVARYGEYSKPEEFAYDRPFLWGSRRTGPDLARIGGTYPDAWHYQHMADPQGMFPKSNMPPYAWLGSRRLATDLSARKAAVLGYGVPPEEVARQIAQSRAAVTAAAYPSAAARARAVPASHSGDLTELDALVAYLQKVGRDLKRAAAPVAAVAAETALPAKNPFSGNRAAVEEGERIFKENCRACHGEEGKGGFGPNLRGKSWKFGGTDADLYRTVSGGRPGGMPSFGASLGEERIWKVLAYVRSLAGK